MQTCKQLRRLATLDSFWTGYFSALRNFSEDSWFGCQGHWNSSSRCRWIDYNNYKHTCMELWGWDCLGLNYFCPCVFAWTRTSNAEVKYELWRLSILAFPGWTCCHLTVEPQRLRTYSNFPVDVRFARGRTQPVSFDVFQQPTCELYISYILNTFQDEEQLLKIQCSASKSLAQPTFLYLHITSLLDWQGWHKRSKYERQGKPSLKNIDLESKWIDFDSWYGC